VILASLIIEQLEDDKGLSAVKEPDWLTCVNHSHIIIHMLDDLEQAAHSKGKGSGFHKFIQISWHARKEIVRSTE
jgi:hypothetical protein